MLVGRSAVGERVADNVAFLAPVTQAESVRAVPSPIATFQQERHNEMRPLKLYLDICNSS